MERARSDNGPTLVEAKTLRMMPHSSSDDHLRYRSPEDLDLEKHLDPLPKFRDLLVSVGILDEQSSQTLNEMVDQEIESAIEAAESAPSPWPDSAFNGVYAP